MASLYWLEDALRGILPTLWMTLGIGLPWAYALLSRKHWHSHPMVIATSLIVGPAWLTFWMLILGVIGAQLDQRLFTSGWILGGTIVITLTGTLITWFKRKNHESSPYQITPLAIDEKLIITLIAIAVIIRWIHTAFWTFTAYDALWVYGFQGRLYFLEGFIPHSIDYYPQFLQLQYTFVQVMIGEINDHAARMVIPMMHIGSIFATYLLGERLLNRRVGLFAAALWSLHPYVGQWSFIGDLEIPVTYGFTMASAFFLTAWAEKEDPKLRRYYAILAGLMLGIAMYTKPTAGAFIWGVVLLVALDLLRVRFRLRQWLPRFMIAFWTGLACIPLGSIWYLRNIALGHDAITLPPDIWITLARRSADHFNWILLAIIVAILALVFLRKLSLTQTLLAFVGIGVLLIGVLPSNPVISPERFDPPQSYITLTENFTIVAGLLIIGVSLLPIIQQQISRKTIGTISWALLLALPYFITWFYSYSYHYRLGFAIVPLLILPTAYILSRWFSMDRMAQWSRNFRISYIIILIALSIPGIISVAVDVTWSTVWLAKPELNSDLKKYQVFNPSLLEVYYAITEYRDTHEPEPIIVAPGEQRLHFFFPQMQIINRNITTLDEFEALNATHFLYGTQARWSYERAGINPNDTQLISALGRPFYFEEAKYHTDATFSYEVYQKVATESRFELPITRDYPIVYTDSDIIFGDAIRFTASGVSPQHIYREERAFFTTAWQALQPIKTDYKFVFELYNTDEPIYSHRWFLNIAPNRHTYYSTTVWQTGETIHDWQYLTVPKQSSIEAGKNFKIRVRVYDPINNRFLPVYINGEFAGEFYTLEGNFRFGRA